jgi:adenylate cyclase
MSDATTIERRLTAVAFADLAGYSRLIGQDDVQTVLRWKALRRDLLEPKIIAYRGRLLRVVGDGLLIEFKSVVDAVQWATDVQAAIASAETPDARPPLALRIGINVEDVLIDGDELHGDGVNIAARIQQLAAPGEVVVTAAVRDYVLNKIPVSFRDLGLRELKNISRQIHIYRVETHSQKAVRAFAHPQPQSSWSNRPSIAVLPFRDPGGDPSERYFGEGITEEIIGGLARNRSLLVMARHSTLPYRDRQTDISQIANELGVRYVVAGSVRRQASRLRISADLTDVAQNRTIWADRYDGANDDVFEFQDRIASRIVATIEPRVYDAESVRARAKPTENLDAYDCVLRAFPLLYSPDEPDFDEAGRYFDRAVSLDPAYAQAHAYKAWWHVLDCGERRSKTEQADAASGEEAARRAIGLDPNDAFALAVAAHVEAFLCRRPEQAAEMFDRALQINSSCAYAWGMSAITYCYLGRPDDALERLARLWRLSPFDPLNHFFWGVAGFAELLAGRYERALEYLEKGRHGNPGKVACQRNYTACLALLGRLDEAKAAAQELLTREPGFRVSSFAAGYMLRRPDDIERLLSSLRAAGVPE